MNIQEPNTETLQKALHLETAPEYVATGGFKAVYKFRTPQGIDEALKAVYIPSANTDEETLQRNQLIARATREIKALEQCEHPNIVKLGSVKAAMRALDGQDYLVYSEEFLPGKSLAAWMNQANQATFSDLWILMRSMTDLIGALSGLGYLHRDIKPDNIMETRDSGRRFVALDMGIAYKMEGTQLTRGGSPPGTVRYMAPELLKPDYKDNMDFRCDLYSAGLTVYVLATKSHPFAPRPEHAYATVYRIMNTLPNPLAQLRPDLPDGFCRIIDRCIKKRPALRYGNLRQLADELERISP